MAVKRLSLLTVAVLTTLGLNAPLQAAEAPDLTGVWYHIKHKQVALANAEYQRLQNRYPDWQPEESLKQAISLLNKPVKPVVPVERKKETVKEDPDAAFMGRLAAMKEKQWQRLSVVAVSRAATIANRKRNDADLLLTGWIYMARQQYNEAMTLFSLVSEGSAGQKKDAIGAAVDALSFQAMAADDLNGLQALYDAWPQQVPALINGAAWQAFDAGEFTRSGSLFRITGNRYGEVLSLDGQGHSKDALALACTTPATTELTTWCRDGLSSQQTAAWEAKDYAASIRAAESLKERNLLSRDQEMLYGWALDESGNKAAASKVFLSVLADSPADEEVQSAVIHSFDYNAEALMPLSAKYPFIATFISSQEGGQAFGRKQFDLADRYKANPAKESTAGDLQVYAGLSARHRSGERGLGHLDEHAGYTGFTDVFKDTRVDVSVRHEQVFSGTPDAGSWFGTGLSDADFAGEAKQAGQGIDVSLTRQEQDWTWCGQAGYLLLDQPVSTRLTGALGATWYQADFLVSGLAYRERRKDSVLSQTGTWFDTSSRESSAAWGGVMQTGLRGLGVVALNDVWSASLSAETAMLDGEQVKDNSMHSLRVEVSRELSGDKKDWLDYFRVAPYLGWQQYDHDLSGFTAGHGGYFSPQGFFSTGVSTDLLSAEGKLWQLRGRFSLGWSSIKQDGGPRFPLTDDSVTVLPSTNVSGVNGELLLEGQYLFGNHWSLAGYVSRSHAVAYQATYAGIELRWYAAPRKGVTSATLIGSSVELKGFAF